MSSSRDETIASAAAVESPPRAGLGRWFPCRKEVVVSVDCRAAEKEKEEEEEEGPTLVQPELFVTTRQFRAKKSLIGRLPRSAKDALSTGGVCHFMAVYRSERGELWQLDFGPFGGDVHSRLLSDANAAADTAAEEGARRRSPSSSSSSSSAASNANSTPGHIREKLLDELPTKECEVFYVGSTSMTLDEVRAFNATRDTTYTINKNDCRHYVNDLCRLATGIESACSKYVRGAVWGRDMLSSSPSASLSNAAAKGAKAEADGAAAEASNGPAGALSTTSATVEQRRRRKHELAVLLPISLVTDLENAPLWDRLGRASSAALVIGIAVRAVPPALVAMAASCAAAGAGASVSIARQRAAGMGAAAAGVGAAAEAGGLLARAAAVTQPLVAPTVRRLITTAAGVAGGAREDIADNVRRGQERAARVLVSLRSGSGSGSEPAAGLGQSPYAGTSIGRAAAVPTVGWAGRKLAPQCSASSSASSSSSAFSSSSAAAAGTSR